MNQDQKIKQFIEKYCQGYQGWSKERTLFATKDLKSLVDSAVEKERERISIRYSTPPKKRGGCNP